MTQTQIHAVIWIFMNLAIAAMPLVANGVAHVRAQKKIISPTMIDDGFLYFFTFLLAVGMAADCLKNQLGDHPSLSPSFLMSAFGGSFLICIWTWSSYLEQLRLKLTASGQVRVFLPSTLAVVVLISTLLMRHSVDLW